MPELITEADANARFNNEYGVEWERSGITQKMKPSNTRQLSDYQKGAYQFRSSAAIPQTGERR